MLLAAGSMSIFAAWSNGATLRMASIGGGFSAASSPASYGGSASGRQGGGMFRAAEQSAPMRSHSQASMGSQPQYMASSQCMGSPQGRSAMEEKSVQMSLAVQGIDYAGLTTSDKLQSKFEATMKGAVASGNRDIREEDVAIELAGGSVIVKAGMSPVSGNSDALISKLKASKDSIAKKATKDVKAMPGRESITNGEIGVSVLEIKAQEAPPPLPAEMQAQWQNAGYEATMAPPPLPGREAGQEMYYEEKCAPPMYEASPMLERSRSGNLGHSQPLSPQYASASELGSSPASPTGRQRQNQGRGSPKAKKAVAAPKPLKGSPEDIKNLLAQLQSQNVRKEPVSPNAGAVERIQLDVPPQAEDEFEKQLLKVSRLTDTKQKADLTGPLQDMSFQDPPEHIQGLAVREALREVAGTRGKEM